VLDGSPRVILDVAHNPDAARSLAQQLRDHCTDGRTWLVLGMLADKDTAAFAAALDGVIDCWCLADLAGTRGLTAATLAQRIAGVAGAVSRFGSVEAALAHALDAAGPFDRIVVSGSFLTVAQALAMICR
jgi:dihydrofolate synthase/folylpolyglutamate synthase